MSDMDVNIINMVMNGISSILLRFVSMPLSYIVNIKCHKQLRDIKMPGVPILSLPENSYS
jgi:hypothetical protein